MAEDFNTSKDMSVTLVGIGASAGALTALKEFFSHVPEDSGMAYVIVVHLSPDSKSVLAELLQPYVKMPVQQVTKTTALEPNHVYVIPPNANLSSIDTHLRLTKLEEGRRGRAPIDHFFRTLAQSHDGHSIGIILTGTGSDGALGIKEIKARQGLTIVQDPADAEYDGMPRSAIATGDVDFVLHLAEIPFHILKYKAAHPRLKSLEPGEEPDPDERQLVQQIFEQVRSHTGRDFSRYKFSNILRRVQRRMQLHQEESLAKYLNLLHSNPGEVTALSDDFLINVTSFFRDANVFKQLEESIIPRIFDNKKADEQLRVWSVGCATGEEAYSLGMLLLEAAGRRQARPSIHVFASDLHEQSITKARHGFYPSEINVDVSEERLHRFFTKEEGGYRVRKELRELVIFTSHNLLSNPPFSRMDLILCRNLLIYIKREFQKDITGLLHYALQPNGFLVLGTSEHLEENDLFQIENKELSVYRRRNIAGREPRLPVFTKFQSQIREQPAERLSKNPASYGAIHQYVVEQHAPPSILLSPDYKVMHISATAGRYLTITGGELSQDVFRLIHPEIQMDLRSAIYTAREKKKLIRSKPLRVIIDGEQHSIIISAKVMVEHPYDNLILVMFEQYDEHLKAERQHARSSYGNSNLVKELDQKLDDSRQRMQIIIEEYESGREEMKASNEEIQSSNEELRSTMEELETSKEELQSLNEELTTLNQENRYKMEELDQITDDLQNLLASTEIATLFLDKKLRILRFTPNLSELFNVREADKGRPISDQTSKLGYNDLEKDAGHVLRSLISIEREVQDKAGRTYLTRILPYRSSKDRIEGVVITFMDISLIKQAEDAAHVLEKKYRIQLEQEVKAGIKELKDQKELLNATMNSSMDMIQVFESVRNKKGEIIDFKWVLNNNSSEKIYGDVVGKNLLDVNSGLVSSDIFTIFKQVVETGLPNQSERPYTRGHFNGWLYQSVVKLNDGIATTISDITERKKAELELLQLKDKLAKRATDKYITLFNSIDEGFCIIEMLFDTDGKPADYRFLEVNPAFERHSGLKDAVGKTLKEMAPAHEQYWFDTYGKVATTGKPIRFENEAKAAGHYYDVYAFRIDAPEKHHVAVLFNNITHRKQTEDALKLAKDQAELATRVKDEFLSTMSHEIRTPLNAIIGLSNLLLTKEPLPEQLENINTLKFSSQNLLKLINDILDYSKLEAGKAELELVDYRLSTLIRSIKLSHLLYAEEKNNKLHFKVAEDVPDILRSDPHKLAQVINNLISNANKFTENGTISLEVSLKKQEKNEVWLNFAVKDTGVGIPKKQLRIIFGKFTQADSSTVRRYGGTGLGLSITKSILQLMGSDIYVESQVGKGSEFCFTLKQEAGSEDNYPDEFASPIKRGKQKIKSPMNLLLVDDSPVNCIVLQQQLGQWWSLQADEAHNGLEAIAKAKQKKFDLILMDIRMPGMDGLEASRKIRKLDAYYAKVPIIAVTADDSLRKKEVEYQDLFDGIIIKPFEPEQLKHAISPYVLENNVPHQNQIAGNSEASPNVSSSDIYTPDFAKVEEVFGGSKKSRKNFFTKAITSFQNYRTDFSDALEQGDAAQLEDVMHNTKTLFHLFGLDNFYQQMVEIRHQIKGDTPPGYVETAISETDQHLERLIGVLQNKLQQITGHKQK